LDERLSEDKLKSLLPALSLAAEHIAIGKELNGSVYHDMLREVGLDSEIWAKKELDLWAGLLLKARSWLNQQEHIVLLVHELTARGIPEAPAILAIHIAATPKQPVFKEPAREIEKKAIFLRPEKPALIAKKVNSGNKREQIPLERYHHLLPDHGWHNDLTWNQLPAWIRNDRQIAYALRNGAEAVGRNVRYRFVDGRLIRRLRKNIHPKHTGRT
jgi:hypothetical protein